MSRSEFRLQRVLELRHWEEQERAGKLSAARLEMEAAAEVLENLNEVRAATQEQIARAHGSGGTVGQLQNLRVVLSQLDQKIDEATDRHEIAAAHVESSLAEYTEALQERRILEKLRERHEERNRRAENEAERKELDEVALTRFTRNESAFEPDEDG